MIQGRNPSYSEGRNPQDNSLRPPGQKISRDSISTSKNLGIVVAVPVIQLLRKYKL
jgi:hypothetical protein